MTAYDAANPFAKILSGEFSAHTVYEDEETLAFMDLMPMADGHCLVIPKAACRNILDAPDAALRATVSVARRLAIAVKDAFEADGVLIQQANEAAAGQTVFHMHVHVIPRQDGIPLRPHTGQFAPAERLAEHAARIRAALG